MSAESRRLPSRFIGIGPTPVVLGALWSGQSGMPRAWPCAWSRSACSVATASVRSRTSTRSFYVHHIQQMSVAAQKWGAVAIVEEYKGRRLQRGLAGDHRHGAA